MKYSLFFNEKCIEMNDKLRHFLLKMCIKTENESHFSSTAFELNSKHSLSLNNINKCFHIFYFFLQNY